MISINLSNFGLFRGVHKITLDKINLFQSKNFDTLNISSNGGGKSSLAKSAITFVLYGDVPSKSLKDLVSFGEKEMFVEFIDNNIRIKREFPSKLSIYENDKEIEFNTMGLKEKWINEKYGDYVSFKTYRLIDLKGINLLDSLNDSRGITTLQKTLMVSMDEIFNQKRTSLLAKKNNCELYNKDKRLYKFSLSQKRVDVLKKGLSNLQEEEKELRNNSQQNVVNGLKSEIQARERNIYFKTKDLGELNKGYCPILKSRCSTIIEKAKQVNINVQEDVFKFNTEIKEFKSQLADEEDLLSYNKNLLDLNLNKQRKVKEFQMKLLEAFKFSSYSYTLKDVNNYTEAIKILDQFSAYYIAEWLSQLELIINDILTPVNIKIHFTGDKSFMKVWDGEQELTYNLLSSGQQSFFGAVFKIAILLQKGETTGLIIADEGIAFDFVNLKKFIEVCKGLNFTINIIYQNIQYILSELENVNLVKIIREKGVSTIE